MTHVLTDVTGVGPSMAETLIANKIDTVKMLAGIDIGTLSSIPGIGEVTGKAMIQSAGKLLAADDAPGDDGSDKGGKNGKKDKTKKKGKKDKKSNKDKKNKKDKKKKNKS